MRVKILFFLFSISFLLLGPAMAAQLLKGRVIDGATGAELSGVLVGSGLDAVSTDSDGTFAIEAGEGKLRVRTPGYLPLELDADSCADISLTPFSPKALYLSFYGVGEPILRDPVLKLIEETELNALVIDAKGDRGMIPYRSSIDLAGQIGAQKIITVKNAGELLESFKAKGIYSIARIVVFKDDLLAKAHPELAVRTASNGIWRDGQGLRWADPFSTEVWEYNIDIAEEAARLGFDEIQFDYVRFPEKGGLVFSDVNSEENRVAAITGFLARAKKRLEKYNVFLSADIFGHACWEASDIRIGQRLEALAEHLDYISPMLYPSGFTYGVGDYGNPVQHPYETVLLSLNSARERTGLSPLRFRPWLQAFRDYAFDRRHFEGEEVRAQTDASREFGANGWMLWNARNVYSGEGLEREDLIEAKAETESETLIR